MKIEDRHLTLRSRSQSPAVSPFILTFLFAGCHSPSPIGVTVQDDLRSPQPWRTLSASEQTTFDLGHAVFNTQWSPANQPAGRRDGLGPLFNSSSCDACHNSRRRGRGPRDSGDAPQDLVIQLGHLGVDGRVSRGTEAYGNILNTSALPGFVPEATVTLRYELVTKQFADGSNAQLRMPHYDVGNLSGPPLPADTVLMPRMPPSIPGSGLLERVPASELRTLRRTNGGESGIGRFGWQATELTVASQTAVALSREMGLTTTLIPHIDCGADGKCMSAPQGGEPEVSPELFAAVVFFQELHAVPSHAEPDVSGPGAKIFDRTGCAACHRSTLKIQGVAGRHVIHPYTDLLLHDLGDGLDDRTVGGSVVNSKWRTGPLWGIQASVTSGQPLRLLHDGRARSIEEAILWHDGEGRAAREKFESLSAGDRRLLLEWIERL